MYTNTCLPGLSRDLASLRATSHGKQMTALPSCWAVAAGHGPAQRLCAGQETLAGQEMTEKCGLGECLEKVADEMEAIP